MEARIGLTAVLLSAATLTGCYDFAAPIDLAPTIPLDPALIGTWRCLASSDGADEKPVQLAFARADRDDTYSLQFDDLKSSPTGLEAHGSEVAGHTLLNVLDPSQQGKPWMLVRYSLLLPHVLRLELVNAERLEDVEPTSWALRDALERRDETEGLYRDFFVCMRVAVENDPAR